MSWENFETKARAKWVLAGEHAVLRGMSAVALPHPEFSLTLSFEPIRGLPLKVIPESAQKVVSDILKAVFDRENKNEPTTTKVSYPEGKLTIMSSIPIGAGLGSSAALCVAISRWLAKELGIVGSKGIFEFATELEHRFHGKSSGMDVAVINADEPIAFSLEGASPLGVKRIPRFTFHDTELRARTSDCVGKVGRLREADPDHAGSLDRDMGDASKMAMEGLLRYNQPEETPQQTQKALEQVAQAMRKAQGCYRSWDLLPPEAKALESRLLAQGAMAVKMTGAGGGGMLVALWPDA